MSKTYTGSGEPHVCGDRHQPAVSGGHDLPTDMDRFPVLVHSHTDAVWWAGRMGSAWPLTW